MRLHRPLRGGTAEVPAPGDGEKGSAHHLPADLADGAALPDILPGQEHRPERGGHDLSQHREQDVRRGFPVHPQCPGRAGEHDGERGGAGVHLRIYGGRAFRLEHGEEDDRQDGGGHEAAAHQGGAREELLHPGRGNGRAGAGAEFPVPAHRHGGGLPGLSGGGAGPVCRVVPHRAGELRHHHPHRGGTSVPGRDLRLHQAVYEAVRGHAGVIDILCPVPRKFRAGAVCGGPGIPDGICL